MNFPWMASFAAACLASGGLWAGTISGSVKLGTAAEAARTLVYVEDVPGAGAAPAGASAKLSQRGAAFSPELLPVLRGTRVDLTNDDWVAHNVFSRSEAKTFDLGLYGSDKQKLVTFDTPGVVHLFCSIHSRMNGVIFVLQNPYFTKPGRDGTFVLDGVPAGTYEVKLFHQGRVARSQSVTVPATGDVKLDF